MERGLFAGASALAVIAYAWQLARVVSLRRQRKRVPLISRRACPTGLLCALALLVLAPDHRAVFGIYSTTDVSVIFFIALQLCYILGTIVILDRGGTAALAVQQWAPQRSAALRTRISNFRRAAATALCVQFVGSLLRTIAIAVDNRGFWDAYWIVLFGVCAQISLISFAVLVQHVINFLSCLSDPIARDRICSKLARQRLFLGACICTANAFHVRTAVYEANRTDPVDYGSPQSWDIFGSIYPWLTLCVIAVLFADARVPHAQRVAPLRVSVGMDGKIIINSLAMSETRQVLPIAVIPADTARTLDFSRARSLPPPISEGVAAAPESSRASNLPPDCTVQITAPPAEPHEGRPGS